MSKSKEKFGTKKKKQPPVDQIRLFPAKKSMWRRLLSKLKLEMANNQPPLLSSSSSSSSIHSRHRKTSPSSSSPFRPRKGGRGYIHAPIRVPVMATFLPNEILLQIVRFVPISDTRTLANLRLTSKTTREFATPRLFYAVKLHAGLEASIAQMDALSSRPELVQHIRDITVTDISTVPVDTRDTSHFDAIPLPGDKNMTDIANRINGLCLALKENAAAEASKIQVDSCAGWCIKFLRSFWRLLETEDCCGRLERLRLHQDRIHVLATDACEDLPALVLFNTLEKYEFTRLEEVELQVFYIRNLRRLGVHITQGGYGSEGRYFWSNYETLRGNMRRIKRMEFSSIRNYDVSPPELQDGEAGYVRREVFNYIDNLERLVLNGRTSIALFNLLSGPSMNHLSHLEIYRCSRVSGCDLVDVLNSLTTSLKSLFISYVQLHKPDKPAEYFSADFTLDKSIDSRTCPWFVIFKTLSTLVLNFSALRVNGLNYCKDEMNPWRTFISQYNGSSEKDDVLLRSPYMTDHDEMRGLYSIIRERRWDMGVGTQGKEYSYFWTKEVTGYDPDKGVGFMYWDEIKAREVLGRCFEEIEGPPEETPTEVDEKEVVETTAGG